MLLTPTPVQAQVLLVGEGALWKYWDDILVLPDGWKDRDFNDSTWQTGFAKLGYGDGDERTIIRFGGDSANKHITAYFRHEFTSPDPALLQSLRLEFNVDDGASFYLNGLEIARARLPLGSVTPLTLATSAADYGWETLNLPLNGLVANKNILAVEVHQANGTSSDLSMNLRLLAEPREAGFSIAAHPADQFLAPGSMAQFSVLVNSSEPLSYQWFKNESPMGGETNRVLEIPFVNTNHAATYWVRVTSGLSSLDSSNATLMVGHPPLIIQQPEDAQGLVGGTATLTAHATGLEPISYQWYSNNVAISGQYSNRLTLPALNTNMAGLYYVVARNPIGTSTSLTARLSVIQPPRFISHPVSVTRAVGESAEFTAIVEGTPPLYMQWQRNGFPFHNTTNEILQIPDLFITHAGFYRLVVTNAGGTAASHAAELIVLGNFILAYVNDQRLTQTSTNLAGPATLRLESSFTNGYIFYTLDGSAPSFRSSLYRNPIVLNKPVQLRVFASSSDFQQTTVSPTYHLDVQPHYSVTVESEGGGIASVSQPGPHPSNAVVTLNAIPAPGWMFMGWLGDSSGTSSNLQVVVNGDKHIKAVFGTSLHIVQPANGRIIIDPPSILYPFGTQVTLNAVPNPGYYFARWGSQVQGSITPFLITVTNSEPSVAVLFLELEPGELSFSAVSFGSGRLNYPFNKATAGTTVNLQATPNPFQELARWSPAFDKGMLSRNITLGSNTFIEAHFSTRPGFVVSHDSQEAARIIATLPLNKELQIESSTNLLFWSPVTRLTNTLGVVQFNAPASNQPALFYRGRITTN